MKIAILSLPLRQNYGGIMQTFALQEYLKQLGHDVIFINRHKNTSDENIGSYLYQFISQDILHCNIQNFIHQHINSTSPIVSQRQLEKIGQKVDAVVVGSDQVWRLSMIKKVETNYFLDFVPESCRKIAYSASFGSDTWEGSHDLTEKIKLLIQQFNAISVREIEGVDICNKVFSVKAEHTLDPVFLHSREFYESIIKRTNPATNTEDVLFYYFLGHDRNQVNATISLAQKLHLKPKTLQPYWKFNIGKFEFSAMHTPQEWLSSLLKAKFIVTDSFHATAFALIFNKPFIVVPNISGGLSRIHSILSIAGLESRLINAKDVYTLNADVLDNINYEIVNNIIAEAQGKSIEYLINSLNMNNNLPICNG